VTTFFLFWYNNLTIYFFPQEDNSIKDEGNNQKTTHETEPVDDKLKTIAIEAQRKLDEKTRYVKDPTEPVVNTREKVSVL
jgi:hypothetical protein